MVRPFIWVIVLSIASLGIAHAGEGPRGAILLLESCPGDEEPTGMQKPADEALLPLILAPLLTGLVSQGMKTGGEKLQAAAKEAQVEVLHVGDYFYTWKNENGGRAELKNRCIIVGTRGTGKTSTTLAELSDGYAALSDEPRWTSNPDELIESLKKMNFSDKKVPSIVGVFDVELSKTRSEARIVPRFVVLDHSLRERTTKKKEWTYTFEFSLSTPEKAFGSAVIKIDGLKAGNPFTQTTRGPDYKNPIITSQWFALPGIDPSVKAKVTATKEANQIIKVEKEASRLAWQAAKELGEATLPKPDSGGYPECPARDAVVERLAAAHSRLVKEKTAVTQSNPNLENIAKCNNMVSLYDACRKRRAAEKIVDDSKLASNASIRTFDLGVVVKEFRKRPAAQFFGDLLTDETTRTGVAGAVVKEFDPTVKAEKAKAEQEAAAADREAYETALVAAEAATNAYETAAIEERAAKYIDMEAKKRKANRVAEKIGVAMPYPGAGTWFTGP